jgi:hypothetical protein
LTEIHSKRIMPLSLSGTSNTFTNVNKTTCKLYVPKGSYSAYWLAPGWGDFLNIIEEDVSAINTISTDKLSINLIANGIVIETKETLPVAVYNISGQKVHQSIITGSREINLQKGVYIVRVNKESQKVIVK